MRKWVLGAILILLLAFVAISFVVRYGVTTKVEYQQPPQDDKLQLVDDRLEGERPAFDETLVDSRLFEGWEVNQSAAVFRLDCPILKPDEDADLLTLHGSYADAIRVARQAGSAFLPSANLLDGAAKQFDDGLYAALDLAMYRGGLGVKPSPQELVESLFNALPPDSPGRAFLAAALELAGKNAALSPSETAEKQGLLKEFNANEAISKPISFYTWTPELEQVWRFFRFLQFQFDEQDLSVPQALAVAMQKDAALAVAYRKVVDFYGRLTNPMRCLALDQLTPGQSLQALAAAHGVPRATVAVFPPSTSRENELFETLFSGGLPLGANLMAEFIRAIQSGTVDLKPKEKDGWYQHQVYALETFLMPSKGAEGKKLLLTASYKRRLIEAFKALVVKRIETHARQFPGAAKALEAAMPMPKGISPRLRIEPLPTFYLRTARAYGFLENFLGSALGEGALAGLHGMREGGAQDLPLAEELAAIRERFYGFYLVACEDLGMRPSFLDGEPVQADAAIKAALRWLDLLADDPDLAQDTRVSVPLVVDVVRNRVRLWGTAGVRLAKLEASYAIPPRMRHPSSNEPWKQADWGSTKSAMYVMPVDEFLEFEISGTVFTRDEWRALCDRYKTKEGILEALAGR